VFTNREVEMFLATHLYSLIFNSSINKSKEKKLD